MLARAVPIALLCLVLIGCQTVKPVPMRSLEDVLYGWQDESLSLTQKYQLNPLRTTRVLAALHQGLWRVKEQTQSQPIECQLGQLDFFAASALEYFFPLESPGRLLAIAQSHFLSGASCDLSAANRILADVIIRAKSDGAFPPRKLRTNAHPFVGEWKPTAPMFVNTPTEPFAGEWSMYSGGLPGSFSVAGPPQATSQRYLAAVQTVIATRERLTEQQKRAAEDWNLEAGSVTPPGVWNIRLRAMLRVAPEKPDQFRLFAVLNMAMHDAMVACWHFKFTYWTERPITAADRLGLGGLKPWLQTPPFPSYPSGHATVSGAAQKVIAHYLPSQAGELSRLSREAADSRLWGGIHFDFDNEDGLMLGRQVGDAMLKKVPKTAISNR